MRSNYETMGLGLLEYNFLFDETSLNRILMRMPLCGISPQVRVSKARSYEHAQARTIGKVPLVDLAVTKFGKFKI